MTIPSAKEPIRLNNARMNINILRIILDTNLIAFVIALIIISLPFK
jgi:hypothetical protein